MNVARSLFRLLLGKRLPRTEGTLEVEGVDRPVTIHRDRWGIPYIEAESDADAWYALGFCQGQDRPFQLEGLLRVVRGTLAALVGTDGLSVDRLSRRIGFYRAAREQLALVDAETRAQLEAFARGVTAGATTGLPRPDHAFTLLRTEPMPYTAADILGVMKLMSFLLASNWDSELVRLKILTADGPEALQAIDHRYPANLPVTKPVGAPAGPALDHLAADLAVFLKWAGPGGGSNNWVLAGSRTATGRPILANDPHLSPALPPHWYLAHIRTPAWTVAGASFAGSPGFPIGFNEHGAWGLTAGFSDNTDLYIETVGADGRSVREGNEYVSCDLLSEEIEVKGGEAVTEQVLVTARGPIVTPPLGTPLGQEEPFAEQGALSLQAVWLQPLPVKGLMHLHHARSFTEFRHLFEAWPSLPLNMVYAGVDDSIGWQLVGQIPRRRSGCGTLPLPGAGPNVGWEEELVPFAQMPCLENPEAGFLATANNKPLPDSAEPFLGVDWSEGYRLARIVEVLAGREDWDLDGMQTLQVDQRSLLWAEIREAVLATPAVDGDAGEALRLLRAWDGIVTVDSVGATVFEFFQAEMVRRIVAAKAPRSAAWALSRSLSPLSPDNAFFTHSAGHLLRLLREQPAGWFADGWPLAVGHTLGDVYRMLRDRFGADSAAWHWGDVRPLTLHHPLGDQAPLDRIYNRGPFPWGGDSYTVAQAAVSLDEPTKAPFFIASLRMAVDVGNWAENYFVLPGGQSGNPLSPHYDDQLPLWREGRGLTLAWTPAQVAQATVHTLVLQPSAAGQ